MSSPPIKPKTRRKRGVVGVIFRDGRLLVNNAITVHDLGLDGSPAALDAGALDGTNGFTFLGTNIDDRMGYGPTGIGDVNGDGLDDFIVIAARAGSGAGEGYVVFGTTSGFAATLAATALDGTNGFTIVGSSFSPRHAAAVGDFNGASETIFMTS